MLPTAGSAFRSRTVEPWGLCKYLDKRSGVIAAVATGILGFIVSEQSRVFRTF